MVLAEYAASLRAQETPQAEPLAFQRETVNADAAPFPEGETVQRGSAASAPSIGRTYAVRHRYGVERPFATYTDYWRVRSVKPHARGSYVSLERIGTGEACRMALTEFERRACVSPQTMEVS